MDSIEFRRRALNSYRPIDRDVVEEYRKFRLAFCALVSLILGLASYPLPMHFPGALITSLLLGAATAWILLKVSPHFRLMGVLVLVGAATIRECLRAVSPWYFGVVPLGIVVVVWVFSFVRRSRSFDRKESASDHLRLLRVWLKLGMSLRDFPVSTVERRKLFYVARNEILKPFAEAATKAFDRRSEAGRARRSAWARLANLKGDASPLERSDMLGQYRWQVRHAEAENDAAEKLLVKAAQEASAANDRYLEVWDYLAKPEPDGIGILQEMRSYTDPDRLRKEWAVAPQTAGDTSDEAPPPAA